jgi:hypothetical protein
MNSRIHNPRLGMRPKPSENREEAGFQEGIFPRNSTCTGMVQILLGPSHPTG